MLIGRVAQLHYNHSLTHQEIADALHLSRIRVTRLLAEARAQGLVEIIVHADDTFFPDEERDLCHRFGLKHAWIAPTVADPEKSDRAFALVGADAVVRFLGAEKIIALGISTTMALVVSAIPTMETSTRFVPIGGSNGGQTTGSSPHEIALRLASNTGGRAFHVPAPLIAATPEAASLASADPGVSEALGLAASADALILGIGSTQASILIDALSAELRADLAVLGAVGDLGGRFFDKTGQPVLGDLDSRIVGLSFPQLLAIPERLVVARGAAKIEPLLVGMRSRLFNNLVTDIDTARALLAEAPHN